VEGLSHRIYRLADFELSVKDSQGKVDLVPIPVELAELKNGTLTYKGQTYRVRHITVKNLNTDGQIEFDLDGHRRGLGNFKSKGKGFLRDKRSEVEGAVVLPIGPIEDPERYEGFLRGSGRLTFREETDLRHER
jgi:hypothetical protein